MTVRTTSKTVTWPFLRSGIAEVQEAGTYIVETGEELLRDAPCPAYRPIETLIVLPARPGGAFVERVVKIDPLGLEAAEKRHASVAALKARAYEGPHHPTTKQAERGS